ncbi:MAG: outer membrane protein assembly factor BamA [Nitrospirae bacterium]|nr:outer membrane protein assembly factor BamA [Nitrospirota bacterium]
MKRKIILVFCLISFYIFGSLAFAQEIKIKLIEVRGNKRISASTIKTRIKIKEGDMFSPSLLREDLKSIYQMGLFDDVKVETEGFEGGIKIIFIVTEKQYIEAIVFEGNTALTTEKLKEKITIKPNTVADQQIIKDNTDKIKNYYEDEGYYYAAIIPVLKKTTPERVSLIFYIDEGEKVKVTDVRFEGNKALSSFKIRRTMKTKRYWIFSWLDSTGRYKKDEARNDIKKIEELYANNGYIQVQVGEPKIEVSKDKKSIMLTYPIIEGDQFSVNKIDIKGNTVFSEKELRKGLKTMEKAAFKRTLLREDIAAIIDKYGEKGYAFANVIPIIDPDKNTKLLNITLNITEKDKVKVNKINILGNDVTKDKVIRREIRVNEQEIINTKALKRSYERLNNLNFFETIEILPREIGENIVDLDVRVKEKPTGSISFGGGYNSVDHVVGMVELSQGNIFGTGILAKAKGEFGKSKTKYSLSFKEPWLFDQPMSLGMNLYKSSRSYDSYKKDSTGANVTLGRSFSEYISGSLSYSLEKVRIYDLEKSASASVREDCDTEDGRNLTELSDTELSGLEWPFNNCKKKLTSSIGISLSRDSRDNYLDPREGSSNSIYYEYAGGPLGGDNAFYKAALSSSWYFPLIFDTAIMFRGKIGYAAGHSGKKLPDYERFYTGGINTVRGYKYGEAGPLDNEKNKVGGNKELLFNIELTLPLIPEARIRGVLFFDAGRAFDDEDTDGRRKEEFLDHGTYYKYERDSESRKQWLRYSIGMGVRWISPIGPLRLEWGYKLGKYSWEQPGEFEFAIGTFF